MSQTRASAGLREPLIGFFAAVVLTLIPFGFVAQPVLSERWTEVVIAVCGVVQILVHLRYFLHVEFRPEVRDRTLALAFAGVILFIMAGGTLWVVLDLHARMLL